MTNENTIPEAEPTETAAQYESRVRSRLGTEVGASAEAKEREAARGLAENEARVFEPETPASDASGAGGETTEPTPQQQSEADKASETADDEIPF